MITVDGLTVEFGGTTLFKDISGQQKFSGDKFQASKCYAELCGMENDYLQMGLPAIGRNVK